MSERRILVLNLDESPDDVVVELPIGAVPRGDFKGLDRNGASTYAPKYSMAVMSADSKLEQGAFQPVELVTVETCNCKKVTAGSFSVVVSDNESLAVFDHEVGGLKKCAPDKALGALVPVISKDPTEGTLGDKELGWFIGMFVSDGWVSKNVVGLAKLEDAKRNEFVRIAKTKFTDNMTVTEYKGKRGDNKLGNSCKIHMYCPELAAELDTWGFHKGGKGALNKVIPDKYLYGGSRECLLGILSGLLDGDGSMIVNSSTGNKRYSARFSTSSEALVECLKQLMFRLGMRWSITVSPPRGLSKTAYTFTPSVIDVRKILPELYLIGERERRIRDEWVTAAEHRDLAMVPITKAEFATLRKEFLAAKLMSPYTTLKNCDHPYVTKYYVNLYQDIISRCVPELIDRANSAMWWIKVDTIEDAGTREVYDLEVPSTKIFAVNGGLLIWDTMSYSVPISSAAVKEAVEKMMPDRNLKYVRDRSPTYMPNSEYLQGLYLGTKQPANKPPRRFATKQEAMQAYKKGDLAIDDPIVIQA